MKILDKNGHTIINKKFNFFVSHEKYAQLKVLQREAGLASLSALVRQIIDKRKVIATHEKYSLDKAMWLLLGIKDQFNYMVLDMHEIIFLQKEKGFEASDPDYLEALDKIVSGIAEVKEQMHPLSKIIFKLTKLWLPE